MYSRYLLYFYNLFKNKVKKNGTWHYYYFFFSQNLQELFNFKISIGMNELKLCILKPGENVIESAGLSLDLNSLE